MSRRTQTDPEWADEVVRRWQRRRWKWQQQDRALAELRAALLEAFGPIVRWLARRLGGSPK